MEEISNALVGIDEEYHKKSADLQKEILGIAGTCLLRMCRSCGLMSVASYLPVLEQSHTLLAELDVYLAFAFVAFNAPTPYVKPTVVSSNSGNLV